MDPITRRQFLAGAGVSAAGLAAGNRLRPLLGGSKLPMGSNAPTGVVAPLAYSGRPAEMHAAPCHTERP